MLRRVGVALLFVAALVQSVSAESPVPPGAQTRVDRLAVVAANVSPELVAAHEGFVEWLRMEVAAAGVPVQRS